MYFRKKQIGQFWIEPDSNTVESLREFFRYFCILLYAKPHSWLWVFGFVNCLCKILNTSNFLLLYMSFLNLHLCILSPSFVIDQMTAVVVFVLCLCLCLVFTVIYVQSTPNE